MNKRGLQWLSCPLFGKKLAKYVLIVNDFIDYNQKRAKHFENGGLKWISCTLFGEKLTKYVLIVDDYIDYYQKAREVRQKF